MGHIRRFIDTVREFLGVSRQLVGLALFGVALVSLCVGRGLFQDIDRKRFIDPNRVPTGEDTLSRWILAITIGSALLGAWLSSDSLLTPFRVLWQKAVTRPRPPSAGKTWAADIRDRAVPEKADPDSRKSQASSDLIRVPLYLGIAGSAGSTIGWFVWIAATLAAANPRGLLVGVTVGSAIGVMRELWARYREVGRGNKLSDASHEGLGRSAWHVAMFSVVGLCVQVVAENAFVELVKDVVAPFIFSVVVFGAGGVALGFAYVIGKLLATKIIDEFENDFGFGTFFVLGYFVGIGLAPALAVTGVRWLAGSPPEWDGVVSWWLLIGWLFLLTTISFKQRKVLIPLAQLALILLLLDGLFNASMKPVEVTMQYAPKARPWAELEVAVAEGMLKAPDIPAQSWNAAEAALLSNPNLRLREPTIISPVTQALRNSGNCADIPNSPDEQNPARYLARKHAVCNQLVLGAASGLTRSFVVVFGFMAGTSVGRRVERRLRPEEYGRLRRIDKAALAALVVLIIVAALGLRLISH